MKQKLHKKVTSALTQLQRAVSRSPLRAFLAVLILIPVLALPLIRSSILGPTRQFTKDRFSNRFVALLSKDRISAAFSGNKDTITMDVSRGTSRASFAMALAQSKANNDMYGLSYGTKDGMTVRYQTLPEGIKEEIVLDKHPGRMTVLSTLTVDNAEPRLTPDGQIVFVDRTGEYLFHIRQPFAKDASGSVTYNMRYKLTDYEDVYQTISKGINQRMSVTRELFGPLKKPTRLPGTASEYMLVLELDPAWMNDPTRTYPIVVDPTVVHDTSGEFSAGQLNRLVDTGSGSSPVLETYYQELSADPYTVGVWHMDEGTDNTCSGGQDACDSSGNGNHGTFNGNAAFTSTAKIGGYATTYDGTGDYISAGDIAVLDTTKTLSTCSWVYLNDVTNDQAISGKSNGVTDGWYIFRDEVAATSGRTDIFTFFFADSASANNTRAETATNTAGAINTWHHLCFTFEASKVGGLKVYWNGIPGDAVDTTLITAIDAGANPFTIGARSDGAVGFNGIIDETIVSTRVFTQEEIKSAASRRPYSIYTSEVLDLGASSFVTNWNNLSWTEQGVGTGNGETLYSTTNLVAQWNFNETSGTTADNAEGTAARDLTLSGFDSTASQDADPDSSWTANNRRWGAGALQFDGLNSYLSCTDANCGGTSALDIGTNNWSVSAWIKTIKSTRQQIVGKGNATGQFSYGLEMGLDSTGEPDFFLFNTADGTYMRANGTIPVSDGSWHHVVGTYDGTTISIYIDGKLNATSTSKTGTQVTDSTNDFEIGARAGTSMQFLGTIDTPSVFVRALTASEILSNYNAANLELQTRVGADSTPDDGSWEAWRPTTGESAVHSFDSAESTNWLYRKDIAISHTGSAVTEYQVLVDALDTATLISAGKMQPDCDDIRFTNTSGTLLPYFIVGKTCNTASTQIWVQADSIPASGGATVYMFYGNAYATKYSDEMKTFSYTSEKTVAYILDPSANQLEVMSLAPGNSITHNSVTRSLNAFATSNFTSMSQFGPITATKPFNADDLSDDTDGIVPVSWAGTEFLFNARSTATYTFYAIAPWANATVDIIHAGTNCTGNSVTGSGATINCAITAGAVRITSTTPVLIYSKTTTTDPSVMRPSSADKWLGTNQSNFVTSGSGGADYRYWSSANASETDPADLGADATTTTLGGGALGAAPAFLIRSVDNPIGVNQYGDGDGSDGHIYMGLIDTGTVYGSAVSNTDYISIAADSAATCTVYNASDGTTVGSGTATSSNSSVYFLGFGTGSSTAYVAAPWYMQCSAPVAAHYQKGADSESKLHTPAMNRQFTYPAPSVGSPGSESTLSGHSGAWIAHTADNTAMISETLDGNIKMEGSYAKRYAAGILQSDQYTSGLWHLDETGGTGAYIKDSSSGGSHGTPTGTTVVNGISGKARDFNGSSDYVRVTAGAGSRLDLDDIPVTIEAWVKPDSFATNNKTIVGRGDSGTEGYGLLLTTGGLVNIGSHGGGNFSGSTVLSTGQWYHIAGVLDDTRSAIYINGKLDQTGNVDVATSNLDLYIGATFDVSTQINFFDGTIDEVRVSNVARTAEEIAESYRAGRDYYLNMTVSSTDLSGKTTLPFYVAADRPGTFLEASIGESAFANHQPDAGTVGHWRLEEAAGSGAYIKDSSGKDNHGTPTGTTSVPGKIGNARNFNGSSDVVTISDSDSLDLTTSGTVELWFNRTTTQNYQMYVTKGNGANPGGYQLMDMSTTNRLVFRWGQDSDTVQSTQAVPNGVWTHFVGVYDGSTAKIYINGVLDKSVAHSTNATANALPVRIGARSDGLNYAGKIDEVRISSTAYTAEQVRQSYEAGLRTHPVTIDFAAKLDSGNLITGSGDLSFTVDATYYGLTAKGEKLYTGDKIIVRENYDGTEYIAQGTVASVTASTGAATVSAWDSGGTFPSGGYTANADVFKWQREYWNITEPLDSHLDASTLLTLRLTNGTEGRTVWIDDLKSSGDYLTTPGGSTITSSTGNRYFQYRVIEHSADEAVSASLTSVTVDYDVNVVPNTPALNGPADTSATLGAYPALKTTATDTDSDYLRYKIELCENAGMSVNCQTFDQTSAQTGWSGQDAQSGTAYASGSQATHVVQTALAVGTYYWRSYAIDPAGANDWSATQGTPFSFTVASGTPFQMQTGYYIGNGTEDISITGLGFQPDLVIIKDDSGNGTDGINVKMSNMPGETSAPFADGDADDASGVIKSLDADGFTVGTDPDVNTANLRFTWTAFTGSDCSATGTFCVGSYTGNGTSGRQITSVGFQPDYVAVKRSTATTGVFRLSSMPDNVTHRFDNLLPLTDSSGFRTLDDTGFTLGNSSAVNGNGTDYWFFAFKSVEDAMMTGSYIGDGTDNRSISLDFSPQYVTVKNGSTSLAQHTYYNILESGSDYSSGYGDTTNVTGAIKSLGTGAFTVGTHIAANESGQEVYWLAFAGLTAHAPSGTFKMKVGKYTGNGTTQAITNLEFAPDLVIIRDETGANYAVLRTRLMKGDQTMYMTTSTAAFAGGITSLDADGFTVGGDVTVNTDSTAYVWQAFGNAFNPETGAGSADFTIGAITGNSQDDRDIRRIPFEAELIAMRRSTGTGVFRTSAMGGDTSAFFTSLANSADLIQAINSDGFQVGTATQVNSSGNVLYFFAFKANQYLQVGTYLGTGSAQDITTTGISPSLVWVKSPNADVGSYRSTATTGTSSQNFSNSGTVSQQITAILSNGFTVGTSARVNTADATYNYVVWHAAGPPGVPTLDFPANGATGISVTPALQTTATDADGDYIRYKIELCTDSGMTENCQTFDQTVSQTGWSGQNTQSGSAYTSGTQGTYTIQSALAFGATYYWRSYAIDPAGFNTWSGTQASPYSFTTLSEEDVQFNFEGINLEGINLD